MEFTENLEILFIHNHVQTSFTKNEINKSVLLFIENSILMVNKKSHWIPKLHKIIVKLNIPLKIARLNICLRLYPQFFPKLKQLGFNIFCEEINTFTYVDHVLSFYHRQFNEYTGFELQINGNTETRIYATYIKFFSY